MPQFNVRLVRSALIAAALASSFAQLSCSDSPDTALANARASFDKGDNKSAEILTKSLLQKGENAEARLLLAKVQLASGDYLSAESSLKKAAEAGIDRAKAAPTMIETLWRLGKYKEVISEGTSTITSSPADKAAILVRVGQAQTSLGQKGAAKATFESAIAAKPDDVTAQVGLLTLRAANGDVEAVTREVDALLAKSPTSHDVLNLKGDLELFAMRPEKAREYLVKAAEADSQDRNVRLKVVSLDIQQRNFAAARKALDELKRLTGPAPSVMYMQALVDVGENKFTEARDAVQLALRGAPNYVPAMALGAEIHLRLGDLAQAEQLARRVVTEAPDSLIGYRLLGTTYLRTNTPDKALATVLPAIERGKKDATLYAIAGEAALRSSDSAKAISYFEQSGKLNPKGSGHVTGLGLAHLASGDKERGLAELEQAAEMEGSGVQADLALISAYIRDKQFDKALAAVEAIEKKQPNGIVAPNLRGNILLAKGDAPSARKAFETALQRDPKSFAASANLANLDLRESKTDDAKKRFTTLLEKDPKNVQAMLALARIAQGSAAFASAEKARTDALAGRIPESQENAATAAKPEALEWLKRAREADKNSIPAVLGLASWYVASGQPKESIPLLQEALAANPGTIELLDALGTAYLRTDQPAQAMEQFEKVLSVKPDSPLLQFRMGQLKAARGDTSAAMTHMRRAVELEPRAIEPRAALAALLMRTGKPADARRVATDLQKAFPKSTAGHMLEGEIAMAEKKFAEAAGDFKRAIALDSKSAAPRLKLHQATFAGGNASEADSQMRAMLKDFPNDLGLLTYAGDFEISRQHWREAIGYYESVIAKQPNNVLALNNMAWAMNQQKDPRALNIAEQAMALAPRAPAVLDTLGVVLLENGKTERAVQALRQAVAGAPKDASVRLHLAQALAKVGDKMGAGAEIDTLLRDTPSGKIAEQALALKKLL